MGESEEELLLVLNGVLVFHEFEILGEESVVFDEVLYIAAKLVVDEAKDERTTVFCEDLQFEVEGVGEEVALDTGLLITFLLYSRNCRPWHSGSAPKQRLLSKRK